MEIAPLRERWRLCTIDPRALAHIVQHADLYPKPAAVQRIIAPTAGAELLVTADDIRELTPIFWDKAEELRDIWMRSLPADSNDGAVLDMPKWLSRATLDIIGLAGLGGAFESLTNSSNQLARAFLNLFTVQ
ncbi:hypothetical protein CALCODRAFT_483093 [Calocera cornea HHB12733]|uniref:Uncharacterized protein n=1 Tax=Calocera cornea HHB12733 TaxID=1353952 RepID=A0A165G347_9BASI|nr:hypothetical protein CALCODRAFT_483093 [Calocera cornea HHB12733]